MKTSINYILMALAFLMSDAWATGSINYNFNLPNGWAFGICKLNIVVTDSAGRLIRKERLNDYALIVDDFEEDRKISWEADTFVDRYHPNYAYNHQVCQSTGSIWQSQLIGWLWQEIERWEAPVVSCLKSGLNYKKITYYKEKQNDPSVKYFSPYHPIFNEINTACGDITIRATLKKDYKCTLNNNIGQSLCEDKLSVVRNGRSYALTVSDAIVAKLNREEVVILGWESDKGKAERISKEQELKRKAEEEENRRQWLLTAEGKKYLAEEAAKAKKAEEERAKQEAIKKAESDKLQAEEKAKKAKMRQQCERMKSWASDSKELISRALKISMSSISLVRFEMGQYSCLAIVDTPKGPEKCSVRDILQDKKTGEYFADMGGPLAVQAVCGGWAF
jgi:flagellar biosynthesis GTPase FlhF